MKRKNFFEQYPYIRIFIYILIILFGLNIILLRLDGLASLFYEIELLIVRSLRFNVPAWILYLGIILSALFGIYFIPRVEAPAIELKKLYLYTYSDGNLLVFVTRNNEEHAFPASWCKKRFLRWIVCGFPEISHEIKRGKRTRYVYDIAELPITKSMIEREFAEFWMDMYDRLRQDVLAQQQQLKEDKK